jgi:uncharacterized protein
MWCPYGMPGDAPLDQRPDDGLSLCFDSAPATERRAVLGQPELRLALAADQPCALLAARLCDVAPTGESLLVSWGLLNLTHWASHASPEALQPGRTYQVRMLLKAVGYVLAPGHRWRLALSPTYWPHAWPSPRPVTLTIHPADSQLLLPRYAAVDLSVPAAQCPSPFGRPEHAVPLAIQSLTKEPRKRVLTRDSCSGRVTLIDTVHMNTRFVAGCFETNYMGEERFSIVDQQPLSASAVSIREVGACLLGAGCILKCMS